MTSVVHGVAVVAARTGTAAAARIRRDNTDREREPHGGYLLYSFSPICLARYIKSAASTSA